MLCSIIIILQCIILTCELPNT